MKKIVISMLAVIMSVSMLTACSSNNDGSSKDAGDMINSVMDDTSKVIESGMDKIESGIDKMDSSIVSGIDSKAR